MMARIYAGFILLVLLFSCPVFAAPGKPIDAVNSFNLIRMGDGWKITGITFSMATESCEESPLGPPDFD